MEPTTPRIRNGQEATMIDQSEPIIETSRPRAERISGRCCARRLVKTRSRQRRADIRLKLENLQPTNAYKIRGAPMPSPPSRMRARARRLDDQRRQCRAGRRLCGPRYGVPCTVVAIETAPQTKLDRMRALGAKIVPVSYDAPGSLPKPSIRRPDGTFVHPFDNHDFIAGHGTMGLEIVEIARRADSHLRDRRRRADHRRRQRDQGEEAGA
jgi:threonine dehydratase